MLKEKCGIEKGDLRALWELACKIYDPVYPEDAGKPGHGCDQLTDSINPLQLEDGYRHRRNCTQPD